MIKSILIANRGEIACRIIKTARDMGIKTVAIASIPDAMARHTKLADHVVMIGGDSAATSYLDQDKVIKAALESGADAIHPGYGFLSENPEFVDAVEKAGLTFIGPTSDAIRKMGLKDKAKQLMSAAGVPVVPGYDEADQSDEVLKKAADEIGYPVMIKARAGGGGKGMRRVDEKDGFIDALQSTRREAAASFGDDHVLIEKCITAPRHIEVQVFADTHGNIVHLFERDCSLQRRHQKVIEEAPAPGMNEKTRQAMTDAAVKAAAAISYRGAGTVEFIVDGSDGLKPDGFWFMEMNTRLQVEHPVTEMITGFDLVRWQILVASGERLPVQQDEINICGHAVEARVYAEDAAAGFLPAPGKITKAVFPESGRIDHGINDVDMISPFYDPMIAKVITAAPSRDEAMDDLVSALSQTHLMGTVTNISFLNALALHEDVRKMAIDTTWIDRNLDGLVTAMSADEDAIAMIALCHFAADGGFEPNSGEGWRMWGHGTSRVQFMMGDETITRKIIQMSGDAIDVEGGSAAVTFAAITHDTGCVEMTTANGRAVLHYIDHEGQISIDAGRQHYRIDRIDPLAFNVDGAGGNTIIAPMTGVVTVLETAEGERVAQGDVLVRMEAMKMEHALTAPCDGVVTEITAGVGDTIADGAVMITLTPHEE